jgi:hypothetical protein
MNVEVGTEAAQFPEKKYINGIFLAVWYKVHCSGVSSFKPGIKLTARGFPV